MLYLFVTGGVISGVGKGTIGSSVGYICKSLGKTVTYIKIDPYLNVDAGTINPYDHGEVFVLKDGTEVDLDLGCYERFLDINLTHNHNITTGKVYTNVIDKELRGDYLGQTIQVMPHITDEIKNQIEYTSRLPVNESEHENDICIIELGGTINDIETQPFVEAIRQFSSSQDIKCAFVHVCYIPFINSTREHKTKPAQESIKHLRQNGLVPTILIARSEQYVESSDLDKLG